MPWVRLDENFAEHPKVLGLSDRAFRLHVRGLCYAAKHETDGWIARPVLAGLGGAQRVVGELVEADAWEDDYERGGWRIHDFLDYNPSRAQNERQREARRASGQAGGLAKGKQPPKQTLEQTLSKTQANGLGNPQAKSKPGSGSVTDPPPSQPYGFEGGSAAALEVAPEETATGRAMASLERLGFELRPPQLTDLVELVNDDGIPDEWVELAAREALAASNRSWNYVRKVLLSWRDNGGPPKRVVRHQPTAPAAPKPSVPRILAGLKASGDWIDPDDVAGAN